MSGAMTLGGGCLVYSILIDIAKQLLLWIAVAVLLSVMGIPSGIGQAKAVDECSALIANGCFEVGTLGGWKKRNAKVSSSKARSGNYSAQLGNGKSRSGSIVQTIRHLQPHTQYVIEAWLSTSANNPMGRLKLEAYGGKRILRTVKLSQEWQSVSIEFTTGSKANSAKITCQVQELAVKGGVAYCDDLRLLPRGQPDSSATAIPSAIPQPSPLPTPHPTVPPLGLPKPAMQPSAERGRLLWQINTCGNCHGKPARLIEKIATQHITLEQALRDSIESDLGGMGQFSQLSPLDLLDIQIYMHESANSNVPPPTGPLIQGVSWMSNAATLRKASIQLAGRLPTESELSLAATDDGLRTALRGVMRGSRFDEFVRDAAKRHFFSDGADMDDAAIQADFPVMKNLSETDMGGEYYRRKVDMQQEPVEIIRYIVEADQPYTEAVTAPYTMVTPGLAETYGAIPLQSFRTGDSSEWVPATVPFTSARTSALLDKPFPHAGVLSTRSWLTRFPTTDTNRNRHRAKVVMRQFLGYDIEALGQRPVDDSQNGDYLVPTMENPNCKLCHTRIEPIAGAFMDWGGVGQFWENEGQDSLADNYKSRSYYLDQNGAAWFSAGDKWYRDMFDPGYHDKNMPGGRFGFNQPDPATLLLPKSAWKLIAASLNQDTRSGDKAFDGSPNTIWRTQTSPVYQEFPHILTVDMSEERSLAGIRYLPRQDGASGGHAKDYELQLSLDGVTWQTVTSGSFSLSNNSPKDVYFSDTRARFFRWVIKSVFSTSLTANSATAELWMLTKPDAASVPHQENANVGQNSLQWLGQEISKDPDFAKGAVTFWYVGLLGRSPLAPVTNPAAPDFSRQLAAYQTQENLLNPIAERFAQGGFKVKDLLVDLMMSDFFRADAAAEHLSDAQKAALSEVGAGHLLSADNLSAKTNATIGKSVFADPYSDLGLLYNGFDGGIEFVKGNTDITPLMLSAAEAAIHTQLCDNQVLGKDLVLNQDQRSLFRFIQGNEFPEAFTSAKAPADARVEVARWNGVTGGGIASIEGNSHYFQPPDSISYFNSLETVLNTGDNYGERLRAYLVVPVDGDYSFWVAGDDNVSLRMMTSPEDGQLVEIAQVPGYTARNVYTTYPEQASLPFPLKARQIYLLEVVHKESGGGDHVSVAWSGPGFSRRILGGEDLMPLDAVTEKTKSLYQLPIKRNMQFLHARLLGEDLPLDDPEIERTYRLFQTVFGNQIAETNGLQVYCELRNGATPARRAWNAVLAYLMADFHYLND